VSPPLHPQHNILITHTPSPPPAYFFSLPVDSAGRTALHLAAAAGHVSVVGRLIIAGAAISKTDSSGMTPLHLAAYNGHTAVLDKLMLAGADADAAILLPEGVAAHRATAASSSSSTAAADAAAAAGGDGEWMPGATYAAGALRLREDGRLEWIAATVAAVPEDEDDGSSGSNGSNAAFHHRNFLRHQQRQGRLLPPLWPDPEVVCLHSATALHLAAAGRQPGVVQWLLEVAGARVTAADGAGATAAAVAAAAGCVDSLKLLLDAGCGVQQVAWAGTDQQQQQQAVSLQQQLLQKDSLGRCCLHMAALSGDVGVWRYVLDSAFGPLFTPDVVLIRESHLAAAAGIIAAGAAAGGRTVLHYAAQGGSGKVTGSILTLVIGEFDIEPEQRKGCVVQQQQQQQGGEVAAVLPAAAAAAGAAEWLLARTDEGQLAWHVAAEKVGVGSGFFLGEGGEVVEGVWGWGWGVANRDFIHS